jgi:hypothetical protein
MTEHEVVSREGRATMVIRLFGGIRVRPGMEDRERQLAKKFSSAVETMPGRPTRLPAVKRSGWSGSIPVSRWTTGPAKESNLLLRRRASEIYESFWVEDAEMYREFTWKDGVHTDSDRTSLFS